MPVKWGATPSGNQPRKKKRQRRQRPQGRPAPQPEIQAGLPAPTRQQAPHKQRRQAPPVVLAPSPEDIRHPPRTHARGRFVPPAQLAPPRRHRPLRDPNVAFPDRVSHGEHWTASPWSDWLKRQVTDDEVDPREWVSKLGMAGASSLAMSRARWRAYDQAVKNASAGIQQVQARPGEHLGQASEEDIAKAYTTAAGLEPDLARAARAYHDIEVPVPLPFSQVGLAKGFIPYPHGSPVVGHIGALEAFTAAPEFAKWAQTGHTKHPILAAVDAAFLFPFLRPIRGTRALFSAGRVAISAERSAKLAADVERNLWPEEQRLLALARRNVRNGRPLSIEQEQLLHRLESRWSLAAEQYGRTMAGPTLARKYFGRALDIPAVSKVRKRTFKTRELETDTPAAKSITGRVVEGTADAVRRRIGGKAFVPLKSEEAKGLHEYGMRNLKYERRGGPEARIRRLQQLDKRINYEQQYALRLALEGSPPSVAREHHLALANDPELPENFRLFHRMHAEWINKASKYIHVTADGRPELIHELPRGGVGSRLAGDEPPMQEASRLFVEVTGRREQDYQEIGVLTNEAILGRRAGPARVRAGARWQEAEDQIAQELADSPLRQETRDWAEKLVEHLGDSPKMLERRRILVNSVMDLFDHGVRAAAEDAFGNQRSWKELLDHLRFGREPIPTEALTQDAIIQAKPYYEEILKGADKAVLDEIPQTKIFLGDLINAQRKAYELGDKESVAVLQREIRHVMRSRGLLYQERDLTPHVGALRNEVGLSPALASPFISKMGAAIASITQPKVDWNTLSGRLKSAGVKDEEIEYSQIKKFFEGKRSVPIEDVLGWLDENYFRITEEIRWQHDPPGVTTEQPSNYFNWTFAGGERPEAEYGQLTISLPDNPMEYTGGHFSGRNVLMHIRFTTRPVNGKRYLFIEELQSDWMQQGSKRGFRRPIEQHPDYEQRRDALASAKEDLRLATAELAFVDFHARWGVDLGDRNDVERLRSDLIYARKAKEQGSRYEVAVEYPYRPEEARLGIRLPARDEEVAHRTLRPDMETEYAYDEYIPQVRERLEQVAAEYNRLIDKPLSELDDAEQKLSQLSSLYRARDEAESLYRALESDVTRGVADAPFKESWHELGFKRMLAWAVDNGFEGIAFTKGEQQVKRYSMAENFRRIEVTGGGTRVPEPGTYEYDEIYQEALENSYGSYGHQDYIDTYLADHLPSEPDEYEIADQIRGERWDEAPSPDDFEDQADFEAADRAFEDSVAEQARETYDREYSDWEREREQVEQEANEAYEESFSYDFDIEDYMESQRGYGGGSDWEIEAWKPDTPEGQGADVHESVYDSDLEDYVGNELANRIRDGETVFEGNDLMFGANSAEAKGLMERYDKKLRNFAQKYLKKYGVELRFDKLGHRRVTRFYDVFNKADASTVEGGAGHTSLAVAQESLNGVLQHSQRNPYFRVFDRTTGEPVSNEFSDMDIARAARRRAAEDPQYANAGKTESDFEVRQVVRTRDNFQIIPREVEEWVGPTPAKKTYSIQREPYRQDDYGYEYPEEWRVIEHDGRGERTVFSRHATREEAQETADRATETVQSRELRAPTGYPWGEDVYAAALPTPSEPSWNDFIQYKGLTEKQGRHGILDPKLREEFAAWHPDQDNPILKLIREGQNIFGQSDYRGPKGAIWEEVGPTYASRSVIGFAEHGDLTTLGHELFGHWLPRWLPENDLRSLRKWATEEGIKRRRAKGIVGDPPMPGNFQPERGPVDREAAEAVADGMEQFIMEGVGATPVKRAFASLAPYWQEIYMGADLQSLTPQVRRAFGRVFQHPRLKSGQLIGPEDVPDFSVARIAYQPGRPLPPGIKGTYGKVAGMTQYILSGGKIIARGPQDKALLHQYKGAALMSGYFTPEAIAPTARDAILAVRIASFHRAREDLLKASSPLPSAHTDVAIKEDPDEQTPKAAQILLDKMRELDHRKGGLVSKQDMEQLDFDLVEETGRDIFPAQLEDPDNPGEMLDVREAAQRILNAEVQTPIEGIRWIPQEWLDASGLIPPPGWKGKWAQAFASSPKGLIAVDAFNDFQKMLVLYLNPSYVPINLAGNLVMNFMQQGAFLPTNLMKSALMHQWLEGYERKMIDSAMGNGLTASLSLRTGPMQFVNNTLGQWINMGVDLVPRRAAWMHEARRAGYKSKEQIRGLLRAADEGDERAIEDMRLIAYRANDAIVDYERMSPLERQITSRLIFFYPWLKGASRWSMRFILEHPVQAIGLMLAAEHAYTYQQQQLGDVPHYEAWDVPVATKALGFQLGVPGIYEGRELADLSDVFGDHTWVKGGYPMVVDARQLMTFSTPIELFRAAYGLVTGNPNTPQFIDNLTPFLSNSITTLQGYDSFRHKEVPVSMKTWLAQAHEGLPQVRLWKQYAPVAWGGMTAKERREIQQNAINPRTREEEFWRTWFSNLAPAPFSREVSSKRTLSNEPTKVQHVENLKADAQKYGLPPPSDEVLAQLGEYDDMNHELKQGMTPQEELGVIAKYIQRHPETGHSGDVIALISRYGGTDARMEHLRDHLRGLLEHRAWGDYWQLRHRISRAEETWKRHHRSAEG